MSYQTALQNETLINRVNDEPAAAHLRAERTDNQLVDLVLAGDGSAFEQIFDRHKRLVAIVANRYFRRPEEVEEIIQISFAKVFTELGHVAIGLEGAPRFVEMARSHTGCEVWRQDFLGLDLPHE